MARRFNKTDKRDLGQILKLWQESEGTEVIDFKACTKFAIENDLYDKPPITTEQQCEADLRKFVKRATYLNARGEKIRIYGSARLSYKGEQLPLFYVDMRIAKPDVAKDVFDQNYARIRNDVRRHSIEKQSYDDFNPYAAQLPFYDYNFTRDADDARLTGEYDDSYDDEDPDTDSDSDTDSDD
jgi:hypothetical protein